jgi:HemY protein
MNKLFFSLIILLLAIGLGFLVHQDQGFVLIGYNHYTVELTFWMGLVLLIVLYLVFNLLGWAIQKLTGFNLVLRRWKNNRKANRAATLTQQGLCELAMGEWQQAEMRLKKAAKHTPSPLINYLACAYATHAQNQFEQRDHYLRLAHQTSPESELAIGLTQASLQLNSQQLEQALATLNHLHSLNSNHPYILKLLAKTLYALKEWDTLEPLLSKLKRHQVFTQEKFQTMTRHTYQGKLEAIEKSGDAVYLQNIWQRLPRPWRDDTQLITLYINLLLKFHKHQEAYNLIVLSQRRHWRVELLPLYAQVESDDLHQQITVADNWLSQHSTVKELKLCLAQLNFQAKLFGRAQQLLTDYLHQTESHQAYYLLGQVQEALNEPAEALAAYKKALQTSTSYS